MKRLPIILILAGLAAAPMDHRSAVHGEGSAASDASTSSETPQLLEDSTIDASQRVTLELDVVEPSPAAEPAQATAPGDAARVVKQPNPDAIEVFRSSFEDESDADFDGWPEGWTRKRGPDYPWYLDIGINSEPAVDGEHALRIRLNGGAGAVFSPPIRVRTQFSYVFQGYIRTEGLQADRAFYSVTFYDEVENEVAAFRSERISGTTGWQKLNVGPMATQSPKVHHAVIGLHLAPGVKADLTGSASFDHIWLGRLPSMTLSTNRPYNVYTDTSELEVGCKVSGIFEREPLVQFQVLDIEGREVLSHSVPLVGETSVELAREQEDKEAGFQDSTTWKPVIREPGFYRIRCRLQCREGMILEREQTLVVIEPTNNPPRGEFGWTLPSGDKPLSLASLEKLLPQVGINWVKLPMWVSDAENRRLDQLVAFAERMSARGIETVGLLSEPPEQARSQFGDTTTLLAADMFSLEPELWYPLLEPVMARLSLQVRWWQLGLDNDVSFVGYPSLVSTIAKIKAELQRFGQEVNLGFGWRVFDEQLPDKSPPWQFLALTGTPQMTEAELKSYLAALDGSRARRWVCLEPLSSQHYSMETRAGDLIHRMLAAKMAKAEGVFITDPFSPTSGLMNSDGTPGELLLPWRTTSLVLAGSEYLGSIQLPKGSQNYIFERDGQVMMVVWNDHPTKEKIYLGDDVRVSDVWGRSLTPKREDNDSVIDVGPMPGFVMDINPAILRWNMSVGFHETSFPSVFGITHDNALLVKNFFGQGVSAKARLNFPESWKVVPRVIDFKMATGEESVQPFGIGLPYDAGSGREPVRIDFEVNADQVYKFSVFRHIDVGKDDVLLDVATRLNDRGELEVEQFVTNKTDVSVSFKCFLLIPERRRLMTQVIELGQDRDRKLYRLPNGPELIGKTLWLRAEEIGGNRTLNKRFVAEE
jgi:hypothetical protein